ncbi:5'/3'-nucleotidase SurE [Bartonella sp. HY329]|uniref:5'/3'-nucleotidase SurE n=1 Tax=unclassified Bartonella TaxID=2645622 RepID=UPI0021C7CC0C|nr:MULTISPECIES: 5'/3'-nucleotidase SurE [unclassified Bartonella]UXM96263.1 5'/3'-nucleotidase SurE [Bartonella sp. HY329]UXN10587.1 5'/3'-nucleotidase SurE [Bartonella sp. HY328]
MRILITNDDGIHAEGLAVLEDIARSLSDDVWVVAPEKDQSGLSHSLTLSDPLRMRQIDERHFSVRGTPTDCVIMAIKHILPQAPDIVLSGVNSGGNLADDVTYSGTIAAAMEGTLLGVRSFALSQEYVGDNNERIIPWDTARQHAPTILQKLIALPHKQGVLTNINFPACAPDEIAGIDVTCQGHIAHDIYIDERHDGRGFPYFWLKFSRNRSLCAEGTDAYAIDKNKISITPLHLDLTADEQLIALKKAFA